MAKLNISIKDAQITPNPAGTGEAIKISVTMENIVFGLLTGNSELILTGNNEVLEYVEG